MITTQTEKHVTIRPAQGEADLTQVRALFRAYADSLDIELNSFQDFDAELQSLPGKYAPPHGALLLAEVGGEAAGCVALRKIGGDVCEMKRLFVHSKFRSLGVGKRLALAIISRANELGYRTMKLDTLTTMASAVQLYHTLGFVDTDPYVYNPMPEAKYMELSLGNASAKTK